MDRRALLLVPILALILVAGAFAFVDFHAMGSMTDTKSSVSTAQANQSTAPKNVPMTLVVLGEDPLADEVGTALAATLSDSWAVERTDELSETDGPILVVKLTDAEIAYNPVVPSAQVTARFSFVGSGNVTLAEGIVNDQRPIVMGNRDRYAVWGEVTVEDRSRGIVSWPGYRTHVSEAVVGQLEKSLTSAPGM